MTELVLLTSNRPMKRLETGFEFEAEEVVGVIEGNRTLLKYDYRTTGNEVSVDTGIDGQLADRIIEAFRITEGFSRYSGTYINCHLFIFFALNKARSLEGDAWISQAGENVGVYDTEVGKPYATSDLNGNVSHSFMGISQRGKGLSVLGYGGDLTICDTETLLRLYEADAIFEANLD